MQENLKRDATEKEQRADQKDEARVVFAKNRQVAQGRDLEGQQQWYEVHGGDQEEGVLLAALWPLEGAELLHSRAGEIGDLSHGFRDRFWLCAAGLLFAKIVQYRLAQILIRDEEAEDDVAEEAAETDVRLACYRMRLGVVKGVEKVRQQIEILAAMTDLLHRRVSEQHRRPAVGPVY